MTTSPPTRASAAARMSKGYAARDPQEHVAQRLARAYERDEDMERLAALRDDPARWSALPQSSRLSVGYYVASREAARSLGVDTSAPTDTP